MKMFKSKLRRGLSLAMIAAMAFSPVASVPALASSHMDAPLITRDPAANTTDVYAFVNTGADGVKSLVVAMGVYPHETPGVGPNKYNFDETVRYELHVATGSDMMMGRPTTTFRFEFSTKYKTQKSILQSY